MPSSTKTIVALSGFLGRSQDWSMIEDLAPEGWQLHAVDPTAEIANFDAWAGQFNDRVASQIDGERVLLGYSMGGRLALHALINRPSLYKGAVIVSANPGLVNDDERSLRRQADDVWASKFLQEPWSSLMQEWNAQSSLRAPSSVRPESIPIVRRESDFDRATLAHAMRTWSLGNQKNLRPELDRIPVPVTFVTGQDDLKFTSIAREWLSESRQSERSHEIIASAGHRVPWDAPVQFRAILAKSLARW